MVKTPWDPNLEHPSPQRKITKHGLCDWKKIVTLLLLSFIVQHRASVVNWKRFGQNTEGMFFCSWITHLYWDLVTNGTTLTRPRQALKFIIELEEDGNSYLHLLRDNNHKLPVAAASKHSYWVFFVQASEPFYLVLWFFFFWYELIRIMVQESEICTLPISAIVSHCSWETFNFSGPHLERERGREGWQETGMEGGK